MATINLGIWRKADESEPTGYRYQLATYTAGTKAAVFAAMADYRKQSGGEIFDVPAATINVVKAAPNPTADVWGGKNLDWCNNAVFRLRSIGEQGADDLANEIAAAIEAWVAAGG